MDMPSGNVHKIFDTFSARPPIDLCPNKKTENEEFAKDYAKFGNNLSKILNQKITTISFIFYCH